MHTMHQASHPTSNLITTMPHQHLNQPFAHNPSQSHHHNQANIMDHINPSHTHSMNNDDYTARNEIEAANMPTDGTLSTTDPDTDVTPSSSSSTSRSPINQTSKNTNTEGVAVSSRKGRVTIRRSRCRICLSRKQNNKTKQLIQPCGCKGSMRYVHLTCLSTWRSTTKQPMCYFQCENCLSFYDTSILSSVAIKNSTLDYYITHPHVLTDLPTQQYQFIYTQMSYRKKQLLQSSSRTHQKFIRDIRRNNNHLLLYSRCLRGLNLLKSFYTFLPRDILLPLFIASCCLLIEYHYIHHYTLLVSFYYTLQFTVLSLFMIPLMNVIKHITTVVFQVESDWWDSDR